MLKLPRHITGFMLVGACMVSACNLNTSPTIPSNTTEVVESYTKGLYVAEAGFAGVTGALETAVDTGLLDGKNARVALETYEKLKVQLDKARTTKQTADVILAQTYVANLWAVLQAVRH